MYKIPKNQKPVKRRGRDSQSRGSARSRRGRDRQLSVRGELRERPDVRRIARAIIDMELARLEAEAQAARGVDADE